MPVRAGVYLLPLHKQKCSGANPEQKGVPQLYSSNFLNFLMKSDVQGAPWRYFQSGKQEFLED